MTVFFDPDSWVENNPIQHPQIYKLNEEQLQAWAEDVTEIRKTIDQKAERYERLTNLVKKEEEEEPESRRSVAHSTPKCNPEGLQEAQIKLRTAT